MATLTAVPSTKAMLEPKIAVTRTQGPSSGGAPGVAGAPRRTPSSQGGRAAVAIGALRLRAGRPLHEEVGAPLLDRREPQPLVEPEGGVEPFDVDRHRLAHG